MSVSHPWRLPDGGRAAAVEFCSTLTTERRGARRGHARCALLIADSAQSCKYERSATAARDADGSSAISVVQPAPRLARGMGVARARLACRWARAVAAAPQDQVVALASREFQRTVPVVAAVQQRSADDVTIVDTLLRLRARLLVCRAPHAPEEEVATLKRAPEAHVERDVGLVHVELEVEVLVERVCLGATRAADAGTSAGGTVLPGLSALSVHATRKAWCSTS